MALTNWVGLDVYSSDNDKIGEVKEVLEEYVVIDRSLAREVAVPMRDFEMVEDHLVVSYTGDFIDDAPDVDLERSILASADRSALEGYYERRAA